MYVQVGLVSYISRWETVGHPAGVALKPDCKKHCSMPAPVPCLHDNIKLMDFWHHYNICIICTDHVFKLVYSIQNYRSRCSLHEQSENELSSDSDLWGGGETAFTGKISKQVPERTQMRENCHHWSWSYQYSPLLLPSPPSPSLSQEAHMSSVESYLYIIIEVLL